jgi:ribosomal protein L11 methyltransferase
MATWVECTYHTSKEAQEAVQEILLQAGAYGLWIQESNPNIEVNTLYGEWAELEASADIYDGVIVTTYFYRDHGIDAKMQTIVSRFLELPSFGLTIEPNIWQTRDIEEQDWNQEWKKYFEPIPVGDRFYIVPDWEYELPIPDNRARILMDIGMAFGTGSHPTTRLCLMALEKYLKEGNRVIDVGTGSGILSIAASLVGAKEVRAVDLDRYALVQAQKNAVLNGINNITFEENHLLSDMQDEVDIILINIIAEVAMETIPDVNRLLSPNGFWIASAILKDKKTLVSDALEKYEMHIIEEFTMDEWVCVVAQKKNS